MRWCSKREVMKAQPWTFWISLSTIRARSALTSDARPDRDPRARASAPSRSEEPLPAHAGQPDKAVSVWLRKRPGWSSASSFAFAFAFASASASASALMPPVVVPAMGAPPHRRRASGGSHSANGRWMFLARREQRGNRGSALGAGFGRGLQVQFKFSSVQIKFSSAQVQLKFSSSSFMTRQNETERNAQRAPKKRIVCPQRNTTSTSNLSETTLRGRVKKLSNDVAAASDGVSPPLAWAQRRQGTNGLCRGQGASVEGLFRRRVEGEQRRRRTARETTV
ncbi:hypothetical protein SVAN01_00723 [Stagonosporopsis vannaccii]|nr:hypothetical protein SVAN01_00723 [Stagonosporopsis vannaccii]